nr:hypothetical protein Iba_chr15cCG7640 [Ipomoea batatas]
MSAAPPTLSMSENIVGRQDKSMELKILGHNKYHEAEKKGKRKIECMDFREPPKKHYCGDRNKVKPPAGGDVRRRLLSRMKAQHDIDNKLYKCAFNFPIALEGFAKQISFMATTALDDQSPSMISSNMLYHAAVST